MYRLVLPLLLIVMGGCASKVPSDSDDICKIFSEKSSWYKESKQASRRWGTDISVMMAIIYQESSFKSRAKPPRKKVLGVIPGRRPASAYGYSQAIDSTWRDYKKSTGRRGADRNDFGDAVDFVGWYNDQSQRKNNINKSDAYNLYLAYHEGQGGFAKKTYRKKKWLKNVARKVAGRSARYQSQLDKCEGRFKRGIFRRMLPF